MGTIGTLCSIAIEKAPFLNRAIFGGFSTIFPSGNIAIDRPFLRDSLAAKILSPAFVDRFSPNLINIHASLLPLFPGAHAVRDTLASGVSETGATIHVVDAGVDTGPIISQRTVPVMPGDDVPTLHERIKVHEREMLIDTIIGVAEKRIDLAKI